MMEMDHLITNLYVITVGCFFLGSFVTMVTGKVENGVFWGSLVATVFSTGLLLLI